MCESIEFYWLMNFLIDTTLIAVIARVNGCSNIVRILIAGVACAFYALMTVTLSGRLRHPVVQLLLIILLSVYISRGSDHRLWIAIAIQLFCGALIVGGVSKLLPVSGAAGLFPIICISALLIWALLSIRNQRLNSWEVTVCLRLHGHFTTFRALIDTGNRLREPISGLPVLIAESALLQKLFPSESTKPVTFRSISYSVLGGSGSIRCFRPDAILIRRGDQLIAAPDAWVAIYPGIIPGPSRALAPSSFAVIRGKN